MPDSTRLQGDFDGRGEGNFSGAAGKRAVSFSAVDGYLDGLLSDDQRAQIEASLDKRADVRRTVDLQRRIDGRLREMFATRPVAIDVAALANKAKQGAGESLEEPSMPAASAARFPWWRRPMALSGVAAAALLAVGAGLYFAGVFGGGSPAPGPRPAPVAAGPSELEVAYQAQLALGFVPEEVCTTDEAFADWMNRRYQAPMVIETKPADLTLLGWSYPDTARGSMGALLATVGDQKVVVFIEFKKPMHKEPPPPKDAGLAQFSRRAGDLMLYQVSPAGVPSLLDAFTPLAQDPPAGGS